MNKDPALKRIVIFSDLDGCLLNKSDYSFEPAVPTLHRIRDLRIPLVLASSKTEAEMRVLADELGISDAPLICENGGIIIWSRSANPEDSHARTLLGTKRKTILNVLQTLSSSYRFKSFEDLQVEGIRAATDLPLDRAANALKRACTEPLVWLDTEAAIEPFRHALLDAKLTLTRGGRFWHVAGANDKGAGLVRVRDRLEQNDARQIVSIAIGDSPIDQGMLDAADFPIGIPDPDGLVHVTVQGHNGRIADSAGAQGWSTSVEQVLDELS